MGALVTYWIEPVQSKRHVRPGGRPPPPTAPPFVLGEEEAQEVEEQRLEQHPQGEQAPRRPAPRVSPPSRWPPRRPGASAERWGRSTAPSVAHDHAPQEQDHGEDEQGIVPDRTQAAQATSRHPVQPGEQGDHKEQSLGPPEQEGKEAHRCGEHHHEEGAGTVGQSAHQSGGRRQDHADSERAGQMPPHGHRPRICPAGLVRHPSRRTLDLGMRGPRKSAGASARRPALHHRSTKPFGPARHRAGPQRRHRAGAGKNNSAPITTNRAAGTRISPGAARAEPASSVLTPSAASAATRAATKGEDARAQHEHPPTRCEPRAPRPDAGDAVADRGAQPEVGSGDDQHARGVSGPSPASCDPLRRRPKTSLSVKARRGAPVSERKNRPTQESLAADPTQEPVRPQGSIGQRVRDYIHGRAPFMTGLPS